MRRGLVLTTIVVLVLFFLVATFTTFRYDSSYPGIFYIAALLNDLGRPIVAVILAVVLAARFRDIWSRRVDISERAESAIARFAQTCGVLLMAVSYLALALGLVLDFYDDPPPSPYDLLPIFSIFSPLLLALPFGYFLFEMGHLIDRDRDARDI